VKCESSLPPLAETLSDERIRSYHWGKS
jgi:hypothetical protein